MTGYAVAEALDKLAPLVADMEPADLEGFIGVASGLADAGRAKRRDMTALRMEVEEIERGMEGGE